MSILRIIHKFYIVQMENFFNHVTLKFCYFCLGFILSFFSWLHFNIIVLTTFLCIRCFSSWFSILGTNHYWSKLKIIKKLKLKLKIKKHAFFLNNNFYIIWCDNCSTTLTYCCGWVPTVWETGRTHGPIAHLNLI